MSSFKHAYSILYYAAYDSAFMFLVSCDNVRLSHLNKWLLTYLLNTVLQEESGSEHAADSYDADRPAGWLSVIRPNGN